MAGARRKSGSETPLPQSFWQALINVNVCTLHEFVAFFTQKIFREIAQENRVFSEGQGNEHGNGDMETVAGAFPFLFHSHRFAPTYFAWRHFGRRTRQAEAPALKSNPTAIAADREKLPGSGTTGDAISELP